jgi:hypothetical protein
MVDLLERHLHLVLGAETGHARYRTGAYRFWRLHVRTPLDDADVPNREPLADHLLAPLAPELYRFQRHQQQSKPAITNALALPATRVLAPARRHKVGSNRREAAVWPQPPDRPRRG